MGPASPRAPLACPGRRLLSLRAQAKQSILPREERVDCFVARAPRNDEQKQFRDLAACFCARHSFIFRPLIQRAQGGRAPDAPDSRVCNVIGRGAHALVRSHRNHPALPAQWFTAYNALSPATGLSCHRRPRKLPFANLTPASGRQDHTFLPYADAALSSLAPSTSTAPRPTFVTIAKRPSEWGGMRII
jgi:hypothetical protein